MKIMDLKKIRKEMEKVQDAKRYEHTLGVAYTAAALAMKHDVPMKDAQLAGLLHDCAKCLPDKKKLSICKKHHIPVSEVEIRNPFLLHSKVGGFLAKKEYGVQDEDIINSILYHTTGRPGMSTLEKIIFIADYIEPGRKEAPHLAALRKLAFEDLDEALIGILKDTMIYLEEKGGEMDPMTRDTYEYYCKENKEVPV